MRSVKLARDRYFLATVLTLALSMPTAAQIDNADAEDAVADQPVSRANVAAEKPETPPEKAEPSQPNPAQPAVDPELVRLNLVDGAVITGKLSISQITVETDFGPLAVPLTKIRRFTPGLDSHTELSEKFDQLIADLGGDDDKKREAAQRELIKMGSPFKEQLVRHRDSPNAKVSQSIKAILDQLAEIAENSDEVTSGAAGDPWIFGDAVETTGFTIVGEISPRTFTLNNQYGTLAIKIGDIKNLHRQFGAVAEDARKSLSVEGTYLAQLKFKSCGIRVERGDKVSVRADGRISRSGSSSYVSGPDGSSRFGTYSQNPTIQGGTLVARVGSGSQVIRVGSKTTFTCTRSGLLRFAIGMRPDYVRYQFVGQYNLKIHVKRGE